MALGTGATIGAMTGAVMGWGMGTGVCAKYVKKQTSISPKITDLLLLCTLYMYTAPSAQ